VHLNIATALVDLGREEEARQTLQQLSQMDPDFAGTYNFLGSINAETGQLAEAVQLYRKAMKLDPGNGRTMHAAAMARLALGDFEAVAALREDIDEHLGPGNRQSSELIFSALIAQSKWQIAIKLLDELPTQRYSGPFISHWYMNLHMFSGNYRKAYEYMVKDRPYVTDREQWQQEFTDKGQSGCEYAEILIEAGDKELGLDLARLFIRNFETSASGETSNRRRSRDLIDCYLVEGSFDKALDILDRETAEGRLIGDWWFWGKMPWWKRLEDNPRYITLVNRIETLLAEQRELLSEMNTSGGLAP
jgi:tetratricopeptide (TPR) repeat protein